MERRSPISLLLTGVGLGAATMYFLDPDRGRRRRAITADRARAAIHDVEDVAGKAMRDVRNRARGVGHKPTRTRRSMLSPGTPERRVLEGSGGALLTLWGVARGGLVGAGAGVAGLSLLACAAAPRMHDLIRVQKTLTIEAPVEEVFEFWSRVENFPRFMEHVLEVRAQGDGRQHWRVTGPGAVPIDFDAEVVARIPNRKLAWRSLPGSVVDHHGEVHFEREGDRATRISVHMAYRPPAGALGHAVASFLHGDPKTLIDDDLLRMKSLLEKGKATANHQEVRRDELR